MNSGIYYILCKTTGLFYIGSSNKINRRWNEHKSLLNRNKHSNKHLTNSWTKYGEHDFDFGIIEYCSPDLCQTIERYYIEITGCYINTIGFNKTIDTISPNRGKKCSEWHKQHLSKLYKGRTCPNKGKNLPSSKNNAKKMSVMNAKPVINLETGYVYFGKTHFMKEHKMDFETFNKYLDKKQYKNIRYEFFDLNKDYKMEIIVLPNTVGGKKS